MRRPGTGRRWDRRGNRLRDHLAAVQDVLPAAREDCSAIGKFCRFRTVERFRRENLLPLDLSVSLTCSTMNHRYLGRSGLLVSEISYGNWITHGSQVEKDAAFACVRAALDQGITTFDTADVYAATRAEEVLGEALADLRK